MKSVGKILLVDDNPQNLGVLTAVLKAEQHTILVATDGKRAIEVAKKAKPDMILLDIMMPGMDGIEVCNLIKAIPDLKEIPIIFITALSDTDSITNAFASGGVDYVVKPIRAEEVLARVRAQMQLYFMRKQLEAQIEIKSQEIMDTKTIAIKAVANLAETRDPETGAHLQRVQLYIRELARELRKANPSYNDLITDNYIQDLYDSSPLHDIGKVGIPDKILLKPGKLTDQEFEIMKTHAQIGYFSLRRAKIPGREDSFLNVGADIAYAHHEKWDGSGYPRKIKGTDIPLAGRLMAFVDVYDALTSQRVYKKAFSHQKSRGIMLEEMKGHFDPEIITVFLSIEEWFKEVAEKYRDDEDWEVSSLI